MLNISCSVPWPCSSFWLFFGFIILIWGLKQLLTIRNQDDTMIDLLETISLNIWNEAQIQAGLQKDMGDTAHPGAA